MPCSTRRLQLVQSAQQLEGTCVLSHFHNTFSAAQVISGLVQFVPMEAMLGRRVVVVLNLKPAKMRDVMSYGMVRIRGGFSV